MEKKNKQEKIDWKEITEEMKEQRDEFALEVKDLKENMIFPNYESILKRALKEYGIFLQTLMVLEETTELQEVILKTLLPVNQLKEINSLIELFKNKHQEIDFYKKLRKKYSTRDKFLIEYYRRYDIEINHQASQVLIEDELIDEIADTRIMLQQIELYFNLSSKVNKRINKKLNRLEVKLNEL